MKPKMKPMGSKSEYWKFMCHGIRPDGVDAYGFGRTMEQAYAGWLVYEETDIPF